MAVVHRTYEVRIEDADGFLDRLVDSVEVDGKKLILDEAAKASKIVLRRELPYGWRNRGRHIRDTIVVEEPDEDTRDIYPNKTVDGIPLINMIQLGSKNRVVITPKHAPYLVFFWDKTMRWHKMKQVTRGVIPPNNVLGRATRVVQTMVPGIIKTVLERVLPGDSTA